MCKSQISSNTQHSSCLPSASTVTGYFPGPLYALWQKTVFLYDVMYRRRSPHLEEHVLCKAPTFNVNIYKWIYVNMASKSVYRSYAKFVLGTKTLTLPTQDNGWLSTPPTELCNYHDNHSHQRPDSAGYGKLRTRYLPVKASSEHALLLTERVVSKQPPPYPTRFAPPPPRADPPTHC